MAIWYFYHDNGCNRYNKLLDAFPLKKCFSIF